KGRSKHKRNKRVPVTVAAHRGTERAVMGVSYNGRYVTRRAGSQAVFQGLAIFSWVGGQQYFRASSRQRPSVSVSYNRCGAVWSRSEEHTSELQSPDHL